MSRMGLSRDSRSTISNSSALSEHTPVPHPRSSERHNFFLAVHSLCGASGFRACRTPPCGLRLPEARFGFQHRRGPGGLRQHHARLLSGGGVDVVVAEENLRSRSAGSAVLGHVVGTDVNCGGGRLFDHLDLCGLDVGTAMV